MARVRTVTATEVVLTAVEWDAVAQLIEEATSYAGPGDCPSLPAAGKVLRAVKESAEAEAKRQDGLAPGDCNLAGIA